jgi:hypothetical protein
LTNVPNDPWWLEYQDGINKSVADAEQYLEVPAGSIASIRNDPDFLATVKTCAVLEPILNDVISDFPRPLSGFGHSFEQKEYFRTFVTALNLSAKIKLAKGLGLITPPQARFAVALSQVRNRYAHNVKNMHRSLAEILAEEQPRHGTIVKNLTGLPNGMSLPLDHPASADIAKVMMYHRLADYLASALHTLQPPPTPAGGLLGGLFATENADTASITGRVDTEKRKNAAPFYPGNKKASENGGFSERRMARRLPARASCAARSRRSPVTSRCASGATGGRTRFTVALRKRR